MVYFTRTDESSVRFYATTMETKNTLFFNLIEGDRHHLITELLESSLVTFQLLTHICIHQSIGTIADMFEALMSYVGIYEEEKRNQLGILALVKTTPKTSTKFSSARGAQNQNCHIPDLGICSNSNHNRWYLLIWDGVSFWRISCRWVKYS